MSQHLSENELVTTERLLRALDDAAAKLQAARRTRSEPIAVIGLGCRFPGGVDSPSAFWERLADSFDGTCETPPDRWDVDALYDPDPDAAGKIYTRRGGFLPRVDGFDARFFGIAPREAASMDPQQRLVLEVTWEALEHAGLAADRLSGSRTGVFVGVTTNDYGNLLVRAGDQIDAWFSTGNALNALAGRVAHTLGLQGPTMAIDTACSSSLVAVHLACQCLRAGDCDLALAGGVNLILAAEVMIAVCRAKMLAPDGRCKTFDAAADGYVRGEGCGVVALRRLSDALSHGENILAVIRGSAVNHDGPSSGFTVPNGKAQEALIREAVAAAGVEPQAIDYLEAHGTGTALGDPIEVRAAAAALGANRTPENPLILGSVKTNIGHLESAAGVAGLIKAVLAVQRGQIPAHLHFQQPNPHVPWRELPVMVNARLLPWPVRDHPRRAGISSFGASGTNAHVVVEQFVPPVSDAREAYAMTRDAARTAGRPGAVVRATDRPRHPLTLSAKTPTALCELARRYGRVLTGTSPPPLADFCFSANTGRATLAHRLFLSVDAAAEAGKHLEAFADGQGGVVQTTAASDEIPVVVFLFDGHDAPHREMARQFLETQPQFRLAWENCQLLLGEVLPRPLVDGLFEETGPLLRESPQGACTVFTMQYALADMWMSWGVRPGAVWGREIGEWVAACVAGVFPLEDALRMTAQRAARMHRFPGGGESVGEPLRGSLERVRFQQPAITVISPVTGQPATSQIATPGYWIRNHGGRANVAGAIRPAVSDRPTIFLEMGPATAAADDTAAGASRDHWQDLLSSLGELYVRGISIDWDQFDRGYHRRRVGLPTYAWQRQRFWYPTAGGDPADRAERVASLETPTLRALQVGNTAALAERLQETVALTDAERRLFPKVLEAVARQHRSEEAAAQTASWLYEVRWRPQVRGSRQPTPDFLPSPKSVHARLADAAVPLTRDARFAEFWNVLLQAERQCVEYISDALRRMGWLAAPLSRFSTTDMVRQLQVEPRHVRLLNRLLEILSEAGRLTAFGDQQWEVPAAAPAAPRVDLETSNGALRERCPEANAELTLVHRCGSHLDEVLRGKCDPLTLLFPGEDDSAARNLYETSPGARVMSTLVAEAVGMAAAQLPPHRKLRVLEIGAGTGGATSYILPRLPADRSEYVFTDVSAGFIGPARIKFRDYPFLSYTTLDIERSPQSQGLARHEFDVVVAANVLHATRDLRISVGHARSLLAPHGLLVLLEGTRPAWLVDLIFGLTDGWWRFTDSERRPAHPLLSAGGWETLLTETGFAEATAVKADPDDQGILSKQSVVIAQATTPTTVADSLAGHWLILADRRGVGSQLRELVEGHGGSCTVAFAGEAAGIQRPGDRVVDPHCGDALAPIVAAATAVARPDERLHVVHLWSLAGPTASPPGDSPSSSEVDCGWGSVLDLVQALVGQNRNRPAQLWLVTQNACAVHGGDPVVGLAVSPLWGMARVIASEHPELVSRRVDFDGTSGLAQQARQLLDEILAGDAEDEVAYRDGTRFVARLVRAASETEKPLRRAVLHEDGTYLITGGLGGLGLLTGRWMVERGARHLVLLGRRAPNAEAKALIEQVERLGASVTVIQADVSRRSDMERVLREMEAQLPPLRGVIHAAGILDDGVLRQLARRRFARVLEPKVAGAWHLHVLTRHLPLDFFVMFSSATSLLGSPGQANHAAANAYLDALAHHRRAAGLPALSINWGAWSDIGAAADRAISDRVRTKGVGTIAPSQGLIVLERLLTGSSPQVAILPIDWSRQSDPRPLFADLQPAMHPPARPQPESSELVRQLAASPSRRRRDLLVDHVRAELTKVLGLGAEQLGRREGFMELGMDSLTSVELRNRLQKSLGCTLPATVAFDYPTTESLAEFLDGHFAARNDEADNAGEAGSGKQAAAVRQADAQASGVDDGRQKCGSTDAASLRFEELSEEDLGELIEAELRAVNEP